VVGAAGYIGGGVARAFRRAGYLVYGLICHESVCDQLLREEIIPILGQIGASTSPKDLSQPLRTAA